jgi:hypothetical protein
VVSTHQPSQLEHFPSASGLGGFAGAQHDSDSSSRGKRRGQKGNWLPPFVHFAPIESDLVAKVGIREHWFGCVGSAAILRLQARGPGPSPRLGLVTAVTQWQPGFIIGKPVIRLEELFSPSCYIEGESSQFLLQPEVCRL